MPRRPVKPQDRQRVVRACDACKVSKKRCDGNQPCISCAKKGAGDACHFTVGRRHHPLPRHILPSSQRPQREQICPMTYRSASDEAITSRNLPRDVTVSQTMSSNSIDSGTLEQPRSEGSMADDAQESSCGPTEQPAVMLSSVIGEKSQYHFTFPIETLRGLACIFHSSSYPHTLGSPWKCYHLNL
jgi:hypothetical protein